VGHILGFSLLICLQNYVGQVCGKSALSSETLEHKCTNGAFLRL